MLLCRSVEAGEESLKNIGHPIEAGPHVEGEAFVLPCSGASAGGGVAFQNLHLHSALRQDGSSSQPGNAGTDDDGGALAQIDVTWVFSK